MCASPLGFISLEKTAWYRCYFDCIMLSWHFLFSLTTLWSRGSTQVMTVEVEVGGRWGWCANTHMFYESRSCVPSLLQVGRKVWSDGTSTGLRVKDQRWGLGPVTHHGASGRRKEEAQEWLGWSDKAVDRERQILYGITYTWNLFKKPISWTQRIEEWLPLARRWWE